MEEKNIKKKKLTISLSSKKPNNIPSLKKVTKNQSSLKKRFREEGMKEDFLKEKII